MKKLTLIVITIQLTFASVSSIFQQNFDKEYFWYHGVFWLWNTPPLDNYPYGEVSNMKLVKKYS